MVLQSDAALIGPFGQTRLGVAVEILNKFFIQPDGDVGTVAGSFQGVPSAGFATGFLARGTCGIDRAGRVLTLIGAYDRSNGMIEGVVNG